MDAVRENVDRIQIYDSSQIGAPYIAEAREIFRYRNLVFQLVRRDLVARYKRSFLGLAWTMLNPLGMMVILSVVFSQVFKADHTYPAYVLTGLFAWIFFSQATTDAMTNLIGGVQLLQRIYMPRTIFAISAIGNSLVNLLFSLIPLLLVMLVIRVPIRLSLVFFPIPVLLLACFTLGVGLILSTLAVYFRDVVAMYQVVLTAWMYLSPILYPESILTPTLRYWIALLNPMYALLKLFRMPVYDGRLPAWGELWPAALISLVTLALGWWFFTRKSHEFAYRI